jgi:hypothetical protein
MADQTDQPDTTQRPATPWWVKVIGVALLVILVLAAIILVVGGGRHGPGMHGGAGLRTVAIAAPDGWIAG